MVVALFEARVLEPVEVEEGVADFPTERIVRCEVMGVVQESVGVLVLRMGAFDRVGVELGLANVAKLAIEVDRVLFIDETVIGDQFIGCR